MLESKFSSLSQQTLLYLADQIETQDIEGLIEVELTDGILKLELNGSIYIINKNSAAKEIWLSSPISGPSHFFYQDDKWQTNTNLELFSLLQNELNINF